MGGRRPDSPETHPGGGNQLFFRIFPACGPLHSGLIAASLHGTVTAPDHLSRAPQRREGLAGRDIMKRLKQMMLAASRKARGARAVPLMVPHGNADSSSDFESAFEMLPVDDGVRELWHREPVRIPFARPS